MDYAWRTDLIDRKQLAELSRRRDGPALLQLGSHFGAIVAAGGLLVQVWGTWWAVPVFLLHGMLLNYLYAAQHELMHNTAFRTRWVNEWASRLTGFVILQPRDYDRLRHFEHHKHTNIPGRDPELAGINPRECSRSLAAYLWRLSCLPYWTWRLRSLLRMALGHTASESYLAAAGRRLLVREARWHVAGYAAIAAVSVALGSAAPLYFWLAPLIATKFTHEMHNMTEHGELPLVPDMLANTRTTLTSPFMRWIVWNMSYHCEHHLYAAVPFYNLPALHRELRAHLRNVTPGYRAFHGGVIRRALANSRAAASRSAAGTR